jgi:hypothetical protein
MHDIDAPENGVEATSDSGQHVVYHESSLSLAIPFFNLGNNNKTAIPRRAVAMQLRMLNAGFATCRRHEGIQLSGLGIAVGLA